MNGVRGTGKNTRALNTTQGNVGLCTCNRFNSRHSCSIVIAGSQPFGGLHTNPLRCPVERGSRCPSRRAQARGHSRPWLGSSLGAAMRAVARLQARYTHSHLKSPEVLM